MSTRTNLLGWPMWQVCCGFLLCAFLNYTSATSRVAVIGGGVAGLAGARRLLDAGYIVHLYEKEDGIGGTWYKTHKANDPYKGLRTNTPKERMELPGLRFPEGDKPNLEVEDVYHYVQNYYSQFVHNRPKFERRLNSKVTAVRFTSGGAWDVQSLNPTSNVEETETYDAVFVCTGRFSRPLIRKVSNIDEFNGIVMHSSDFDSNIDEFTDKAVLVVGNEISENKLAKLSETAKSVTLSLHQSQLIYEIPTSYPKKCKLSTDITGFKEYKFYFMDSTPPQTFDAVIFATGYEHEIPLIKPTLDGEEYSGNNIPQNYWGIFATENTALVFIGADSVPMTSYLDLQAQCAVAALSGKSQLPSRDKMRRNDFQISVMFKSSWPEFYVNTLSKEFAIVDTSPFSRPIGVKKCMDIDSCMNLKFCELEESCREVHRKAKKCSPLRGGKRMNCFRKIRNVWKSVKKRLPIPTIYR